MILISARNGSATLAAPYGTPVKLQVFAATPVIVPAEPAVEPGFWLTTYVSGSPTPFQPSRSKTAEFAWRTKMPKKPTPPAGAMLLAIFAHIVLKFRA